MKITKKTKVKDIQFLIPGNRMEEFIKSFPPVPLDKPLLKMTVAEFCELVLDESAYINKILKPRERAYIAFGKLNQYSIEMKGIADYLKSMEIKLTQEEKMAGQGIDFPSTVERILLDCVQGYNLHSTQEAEKLPITDWLLLLKNQVATAKYSRNYQKILEQRSKSKTKRK